jgi:hypothetical protein
MNLKPIGRVLSKHAGGESQVNVYLVNIYLPNSFVISGIQITECANSTSFEAIIGMDIITSGDFSITNVGGKTVFSFRMPSTETIDYFKNSAAPKKFPGLNDPCHCGSGKLYKKCHAFRKN